ncbi:hypothetical protein D1007_48086 [Hordeum vulgare]|nr:hypothetical protein D1007_48086 [Hordeum vulgare]
MRNDRWGDRGGDCGLAHRTPAPASSCGGNRFCTLPDSDSDSSDDDEGLDTNGSPAAAHSPMPSDYVCESLQAGFSEEEVAGFIDGIIPVSDRAWVGVGKADVVEVVEGRRKKKRSVVGSSPSLAVLLGEI